MFGVSKVDFDSVVSRLGKQEDFIGVLQPRVASLEYKTCGIDAQIVSLAERLGKLERHVPKRNRQRQNIIEDEAECMPIVSSHRGPGGLPLPAPSKGFSSGQIMALATPPGSVTIGLAEHAPQWLEETPSDWDPQPSLPLKDLRPANLTKDMLDSMAQLDTDAQQFRQDHIKHFDAIKDLSEKYVGIKSKLDILLTQMVAERVDMLEPKIDSLTDAHANVHESLAECEIQQASLYDRLSQLEAELALLSSQNFRK